MSYVIPDHFLNDIKPEFAEKLVKLIDYMQNVENLTFHIKSTRRTFAEQAHVYIHGRSEKEVDAKIKELNDEKCTCIAKYIEDEINKNGYKPKGGIYTQVYPGCSWHNWGEAADAVWLVDGKEEYDVNATVDGKKGWLVYAESGSKFGLTAGGLWPHFKDYPHMQNRPEDNPLNFYTIQQVDAFMVNGDKYLK